MANTPDEIPSPECDSVLVERARTGDRTAFGVLVARHRSLTRAVCRRMVTDSAAMEDICQDATLAAWLSLDYLRRPERFASWWCGIVLNHARRYLTARGLEETRLVTTWPPESADQSSSHPEREIETAEVADRVRAAVAALPPSQRHAAYRFYLQGLTYREAAAELGISVNALKARLHQGRKALRRSLNDLDPKEAVMSVIEERVPVEIIDVRPGGPGGAAVATPHIVVLRATEPERYLAVSIAAAEGTPLALSLDDVEMPRPLTHQLTARLVAGCGGKIIGVSITRLVDVVFYATVTLETAQGTIDVDARPSDALNLAALTGAPITAESSLLFEVDESARAAWRDLPGREQIVEEFRESREEALRQARQRHASRDEGR